MGIRELDGNTFRRILCGGANSIRSQMSVINELNVFPVPDGDTGVNMTQTIESGISKISSLENVGLGEIANEFSRGSLFGARGNSGVILSQFFAGLCDELSGKESATVCELSDAYMKGVERSYSAVANPVEGTILTVFRESAEYARNNIDENSSVEDFLKLNIEEAERSLVRTKEILPVLKEADVVDSGGAGYVCIVKGMYQSLFGEETPASHFEASNETQNKPNYDLFTTDSELEYGYCTECLVRLQKAKAEPDDFDGKAFITDLEALGCNSIVAIRDGDVLKIHAHTMTPGEILALCQKYGEFLNIKIENMSLQHSEKIAADKPKKPHKRYGVVTVTTGAGMKALFESMGADVVIDGGQTGNPSAEQFLNAFSQIDADDIIVLPNNSNILLTAIQASELWEGGNVTVVPTKTIPEGYSALAVFNPSITDLEDQINDITATKEAVASAEVTVAIRDSVIGGLQIKEGQHIGILNGELVVATDSAIDALCDTIAKLDDIDMREIITLFVGANVSEEQRVEVTEALEDRFSDLEVEVYIGDQEVYDYLVAIE